MPTPETLKDLFDLLERRHTEHKVWVGQVNARLDAIDRAQTKCDYQTEDIKRRLSEGALHFSRLDDAIKPPSPWRLLPYAAAVLVFLGALIWQAARYPSWADMEKYVSRRTPYMEERASIMKVVNAYGDEMPQVRLKLGVIDYKLDAILKKLGDN